MPHKPVASVRKLQILHGGEERFGFHLDSLREQLPRARPEDVCQGIIDLTLLTKPDNIAILVHGVSFSSGDSGRFGRQPRYAAFFKPSSPSFAHSSYCEQADSVGENDIHYYPA
jgi:hypothetical protein